MCEDGSAGPGDTDGDGNITIADVTLLIDAMLSGDTSALFINNADLNNNGRIDVGDITTRTTDRRKPLPPKGNNGEGIEKPSPLLFPVLIVLEAAKMIMALLPLNPC